MDPDINVENNSGKKVIVIILCVIAVALIGWGFYYSNKVKNSEEVVTQEPPKEDGSELAVTVNTKHQYKNGVHTLAGQMDMPTPCHLLESKATKDTVQTSKFAIEFTSTEKGGGCIDVITPRPFKVSFEGPKDIELKATLNGKSIKLNLFEVKPNEDLDAFEINVKG
ncbi:MAG TPA: hypothetical protein VI981_01515 [Candidatus Paceibacterota bacterium]